MFVKRKRLEQATREIEAADKLVHKTLDQRDLVRWLHAELEQQNESDRREFATKVSAIQKRANARIKVLRDELRALKPPKKKARELPKGGKR